MPEFCCTVIKQKKKNQIKAKIFLTFNVKKKNNNKIIRFLHIHQYIKSFLFFKFLKQNFFFFISNVFANPEGLIEVNKWMYVLSNMNEFIKKNIYSQRHRMTADIDQPADSDEDANIQAWPNKSWRYLLLILIIVLYFKVQTKMLRKNDHL